MGGRGPESELEDLGQRTERLAATPAHETKRPASISADEGAPDRWQPAEGQWQPMAAIPEPKPRRRRGWLLWLLVLVAALLVAVNMDLSYRRQLVVRTGVVTEVVAGVLEMQNTLDGPWSAVSTGRTVPQGASLRADKEAIVQVEFFNASVMRIESAGEWEILELMGSRDRRESHIGIRQYWGKASYVSAAPAPGQSETLRIQVPFATLELMGVATIETRGDGRTRFDYLQGRGLLTTGDRTYELFPGDSALAQEGKLLSIAEGL